MPDVHLPEGVPAPGALGMCGGDFVEVYGAPGQRGAFDCVATCFFLDTAHNVIAYMETIRHALKVGPRAVPRARTLGPGFLPLAQCRRSPLRCPRAVRWRHMWWGQQGVHPMTVVSMGLPLQRMKRVRSRASYAAAERPALVDGAVAPTSCCTDAVHACPTAPCSAAPRKVRHSQPGTVLRTERTSGSVWSHPMTATCRAQRTQEGGLWVNLGPLLYHWADAHTYLPGEEHSIEVSLEDVERVARRLGFEPLQRRSVPAGFNTNARSVDRSLPRPLA